MADGDGNASGRRHALATSRMAVLCGLEGPSKQDEGPRRRMRNACVELMLADLNYAETKDVETRLWRRGCNASKDAIRSRMRACLVQGKVEEADGHKKAMMKLLEEARRTYRTLLALLQRVYGDVNAPGGDERGVRVDKKLLEKHEAREEVVRRTCATCLLRLGDLARYEIEIDDTNLQEKEWNEAETWYRSAMKVWPHAGNPHNQMAVLSVYRGQRVNACYYYLRSLAVKELFFTAKDNLALFFQKVDGEDGQTGAEDRDQPGRILKRISATLVHVLGTLYNHSDPVDVDAVLAHLRKDLHDITKKRHCRNLGVLQKMENGSSELLKMITCCISMVYWVRAVRVDDGEGPSFLYEKLLATSATLCFLFGYSIAQSCLFMLPGDTDVLAGLVVLLEWMSTCPCEFLSMDCPVNGVSSSREFYDALIKYLNNSKVGSTFGRERAALPEDVELNGFIPLQETHKALDFNMPPPEGQTLMSVRRWRALQAAKSIASRGASVPIRAHEDSFALRLDAHGNDPQRQRRVSSDPSCEEAQPPDTDETLVPGQGTCRGQSGVDLERPPVVVEMPESKHAGENRPAKRQRVVSGSRDGLPPVAPLFGAKGDRPDAWEKDRVSKVDPPLPGWLDSFQLASFTARTRHFTVPPDWSDPLPEQELKRINPYAWRLASHKDGLA